MLCSFFFLVHNAHAYGMGKFKLRKKKSRLIHHSDEARDLRKPWRCECKKCTKKLRDENKKHAAQLDGSRVDSYVSR